MVLWERGGIKNIFMKLLLALLLAYLSSGCNKDSGKGCWQAFSQSGFDVPGLTVCDVTKKEAEEKYPNYWFYRAGETKYCWKATMTGNSTYQQYLYGIPESMKGNLESTYLFTLSRIDCSSFCNLRWVEKHQSKITGLYTPNTIWSETIISSDSCSKLFVGRVIVYRETADSLITRELTDKKP